MLFSRNYQNMLLLLVKRPNEVFTIGEGKKKKDTGKWERGAVLYWVAPERPEQGKGTNPRII